MIKKRSLYLIAKIGWCALFGMFLVVESGLGQTPSGEGKPAFGSATFLSVLPGDKPATLSWGGKKLFRDGLPSGKFRGPLKMPAQGVAAEVTAEGYLPGKASLQVVPESKNTFVIWAGKVISEGPNAGKRGLEILALPPLAKKDSRKKIAWTIILAGSVESAQILGNGKPIQLTRGKEVAGGEGEGIFRLEQGNRELARVSADQPYDHVFVVYGEDPDKLSATLIYR